MSKILKSIRNSLLILILLTSTALAGGAKISELKKEAKSDDDGKFYLESLHALNARHGLNTVSLSDKSIVGKKSFRFEVNHGECGQEPNWSDCENERERAELYYEWNKKEEKWKKEKWYRFYVFVPKEYNSLAPSKTSIIQWKRRNPSKVLIMFQLHHGGLYFNINGDTFKPDVFYHLKYFKDLRDQWTEIVFNTNWHPDADKGFMKVWIDGKMKIDYKGVANHPTKGAELNLRYGIYSSFLDRYRNTFGETKHKQRVLYFDGVRGDVTCEKLLKDEKRCNELLSQTVSVYNRYTPDSFKSVRQFNKKDLKYMTMPLIKTAQKK